MTDLPIEPGTRAIVATLTDERLRELEAALPTAEGSQLAQLVARARAVRAFTRRMQLQLRRDLQDRIEKLCGDDQHEMQGRVDDDLITTF